MQNIVMVIFQTVSLPRATLDKKIFILVKTSGRV